MKETGEAIWYIVTDTTDESAAEALGLNHAAKLSFADNSRGVRPADTRQDGTLLFHVGSVDFSPERIVVAGNSVDATLSPFPPLQAQPGSVGDELYSPLVKILNAGGHVYNAPMVSFDTTATQLSAYCDGIPAGQEVAAPQMLHDSVVSICPGDNGEPGVVKLELTNGFSFGRPVFYVSTDASAEIAAALEGAIFVPAMGNIPVGRDDSLFSSIERIFGFTNGPTNEFAEVNPQRQGFNSAISGEGGPLNVLGGIPTIATDYSLLWDLNLGEWTQDAIDNGYRSRLTEEFAILGMAERGFITGPGGTPYGSTGIIINCPIFQRLL